MSLPTDVELREIVHRVVRRTLERRPPETSRASGPAPPRDPSPSAPFPDPSPGPKNAPADQTIAIGADHGGFVMKQALKTYLETEGYTVTDCGTHSRDSVDYPDFARAVAELVGSGKVWRGIIIDGAGIGSCMVANKIPGVRAAMCYDHATAHNSREHNDANVLTLGAGLIGENLARQIVDTWLATPFAGGRHARRVDKIIALDQANRL